MLQLILCHHCHNMWEFSQPLERAASCPNCKRDAKVCLNCQHFDKNSYRSCRESQAEWVQDKEKSNFCDYFYAKSDTSNMSQSIDQAKAQLAKLFGGSDAVSESAKNSQSQSLEDKFKDFLNKKK